MMHRARTVDLSVSELPSKPVHLLEQHPDINASTGD